MPSINFLKDFIDVSTLQLFNKRIVYYNILTLLPLNICIKSAILLAPSISIPRFTK